MKEIFVLLKTIVAVILMVLALLGIWRFYNNFLKSSLYVPDSTSDKPEKEEMIALLESVTDGLPNPERTSYITRPVVRAINLTYIDPTVNTERTLINNIEKQGVWQKMEVKYPSDPEYCYKQLAIDIEHGDEPNFRGKDKRYLSVALSWQKTGVCRLKYIASLESHS